MPIRKPAKTTEFGSKTRRLRLSHNARLIATGFLFLMISLHFALNLAKDGKYFLDLHDFVSGKAPLPFQHRILMAPVLGALQRLLNDSNVAGHFHAFPVYLKSGDSLAYFIINALGLFFSLIFFHLISNHLFKQWRTVVSADAVFIVYTYFIFILNANLNFILPYDLPSLAFTQACTYLLLTDQSVSFLVVFAVATINRETTFLLICFAAFRAVFLPGYRHSGTMLVIAASAVIWIGAKVALYLFVPGIGGDIAVFKTAYNIGILFKPWQWPNLVPLLLPLALCLRAAWRTPNIEALMWLGTYMFGFTSLFVVAQITEQRAFGDLIGFSTIGMFIGASAAGGKSRFAVGVRRVLSGLVAKLGRGQAR